MPLSLQLFQHFPCVSAISQGGIQPHLSRPDIKKVQNLLHTDGNMHSRRRPSLLNHLLHRIPVLFRIQLLVLFFVASGMGSLIADTPFMYRLCPFSFLSSVLCIYTHMRSPFLFPDGFFCFYNRFFRLQHGNSSVCSSAPAFCSRSCAFPPSVSPFFHLLMASSLSPVTISSPWFVGS